MFNLSWVLMSRGPTGTDWQSVPVRIAMFRQVPGTSVPVSRVCHIFPIIIVIIRHPDNIHLVERSYLLRTHVHEKNLPIVDLTTPV